MVHSFFLAFPHLRCGAVLAGVLLGASLWVAPAKAQTTMRLWNIHAEDYPVTLAVQRFASDVQAATGGRIKIQVFSNASLGDQPKAVVMLKAGEIELAEFSSAPLSDAAPGIKALNLPFLFRDSAHMFKHLDGLLGKRFEDKLKASGFVVLGWYDGGSRSFYCVHPVTGVRDFTNKRIRVRTEIFTKMVENLQAVPKDIPFKEVGNAFTTGQIDCAENNMPSYVSTGHYKLAKHLYLSNHIISPEALVMSTSAWDKLSEDDRRHFQEAGRRSALHMRELWNERVAKSMATAVAEGVTVVKMKDASGMIRRMSPIYQQYMKLPETRNELLTIIADQ
jgi:tripartite ATP-independent transporter DctP family solute receptor